MSIKWETLNRTLRERIIKDNPELFSESGGVGGLGAAKPQCTKAKALDGEPSQLHIGTVGLGKRYRVAFTVYRRRLLDSHDNLRTSLKPLCDAVAQTLHGGPPGLNDNLVEWEYGQQQTKGRQGVVVTIEEVKHGN